MSRALSKSQLATELEIPASCIDDLVNEGTLPPPQALISAAPAPSLMLTPQVALSIGSCVERLKQAEAA